MYVCSFVVVVLIYYYDKLDSMCVYYIPIVLLICEVQSRASAFIIGMLLHQHVNQLSLKGRAARRSSFSDYFPLVDWERDNITLRTRSNGFP